MMLGPLILALHNDPRGQMGDPDGGGRLVDMLSAGPAGPVCVDLQVIVDDLDVDILLDIRDHIAGGKGRLPLSRCIEGGDAHEAVHPLLGAQISVGVLSVHLKGNALDARHIAFQIVQDLHTVAFFFRPACIHPVQHVGPVAGLGPARPRHGA